MKTFYLREDEAGMWPPVVCLAKTEGGARNKIAEALMDHGFQDPRNDPIGYDVYELEEEEEVVLLDIR